MNTGCQFVNYYIFTLFLLTGLIKCQCYQFDQNFTGVAFKPYVKLPISNDKPPDHRSYSLTEIQVMLEIISDKFTRVRTHGSGSMNDSYIWNATYYNSLSEVYIAETAARINHERQRKDISIFQGISIRKGQNIDAEINLALECTEKANNIFPNTVENVVFLDNELLANCSKAEVVISYMKDLRKSFTGRFKVGARFNCDQIILNNTNDELLQLFTKFLENTDFFICLVYPYDSAMFQGPLEAFQQVVSFYKKVKSKMNVATHTPELMGEVFWPSIGLYTWETVENMASYWEIASEWAGDNNFTIWFYEAFDREEEAGANYGWWKLVDNAKSDKREGYVEKVQERDELPDTVFTDVIISVIVGVAIVCILAVTIIFLLFRMKKLRQKMSKKDIDEFLEGITSNVGEQGNEDCNGDTCAQKLPYDHSFEIAVKRLHIHYNKILGIGQFGCVFKATLKKGHNQFEEVALKVANPECPNMALKGLLSEIKILTYIGNHANIINLVGAYTAEIHSGIVYVATELCHLGSLLSYLRQQTKMTGYINLDDNGYVPLKPLDGMNNSYYQMLQWSHEIANGMEFLGTKNVVHGDLALRNVLLTEDKTTKITDFGLSRRMYNYTNYIKTNNEPMPWRWMSIESLKWCEFSVRSDIWSYGVTLWEVFTSGDTPYPGLSWSADFLTNLIEGMRLGCPPNATPELFVLMVSCWEREPNERPSFTQIKQLLNEMMNTC